MKRISIAFTSLRSCKDLITYVIISRHERDEVFVHTCRSYFPLLFQITGNRVWRISFCYEL